MRIEAPDDPEVPEGSEAPKAPKAPKTSETSKNRALTVSISGNDGCRFRALACHVLMPHGRPLERLEKPRSRRRPCEVPLEQSRKGRRRFQVKAKFC